MEFTTLPIPEPLSEMRSERLVFESIDENHAVGLFEALGHPDVHKFIDAEDFQSLDSITKFITRVGKGSPRESDQVWLNFVCLLDAEVIGLVQATAHGDWAEIAYLLNPSFQGQGFASEAVLWLSTHLKQRFEVYELWATTTPNNIRSIKLLGRTGFVEMRTWQREIASYDPGDSVFKRID